MSERENELGPLPKVDRNAELQQASVKALLACLQSTNDLILRDERHDDYGVDGSLEAVVAGHATNMRAQMQLKGADSFKANTDGSISRRVAVANVNYLLNGTSGIYILHTNPTNKLWYTWVADERKRLDQENPDWMKHATVSLHFANELTADSLKQVSERIIRESRFRREIQDSLARVAELEEIKFSVALGTLTTTDSEQARQLLVANGFTFVANGFAEEVLNLSTLLPRAQSQAAKIQLVCGYAWFVLGRFQSALGCLAEAQLRSSELSHDEFLVTKQLRDACEFHTGTLTAERYGELQVQRSREARGVRALEMQLECRRFEYLNETNSSRQAKLLQEVRSLSEAVVNHPDATAPGRLQARIHALYCAGAAANAAITHELGLLRATHDINIGWAGPRVHALRGAFHAYGEWEADMGVAINDALQLGVPLLIADALRTSVMARTAVTAGKRFGAHFLRVVEEPSSEELEALKSQARQVVEAYQRTRNVEGELRARMLLADVLELGGDIAGAKDLARDVLPAAQAMGLARLAVDAQRHLSGNTLLQETERTMRDACSPKDDDDATAAIPDDQIERYATSSLEALQLPPDRLPVLVREWISLRAAAREKLDWCRHLELRQNLLHTRSSATAYATDPPRICRCKLHGYRSLTASSDWGGVIGKFKMAYCSGCPDRKPLHED